MLFVLRRFWIRPGSFDEFERLSREEFWPPIEATGALDDDASTSRDLARR